MPLSVEAAFRDGRTVKSVTFVVDENPMPVAAAFRFADDRDRTTLTVNVRLDRASPVRVIVEASDGALYMVEKFVKASGLGVCAAPPIGDERRDRPHHGPDAASPTSPAATRPPARPASAAAPRSTSGIRRTPGCR